MSSSDEQSAGSESSVESSDDENAVEILQASSLKAKNMTRGDDKIMHTTRHTVHLRHAKHLHRLACGKIMTNRCVAFIPFDEAEEKPCRRCFKGEAAAAVSDDSADESQAIQTSADPEANAELNDMLEQDFLADAAASSALQAVAAEMASGALEKSVAGLPSGDG